MARAGCKGINPEMFFPLGGGDAPEWQIVHAKSVCAACSVRADCLAYAIDTAQKYGIWGGLTEVERRYMRPRLKRSA